MSILNKYKPGDEVWIRVGDGKIIKRTVVGVHGAMTSGDGVRIEYDVGDGMLIGEARVHRTYVGARRAKGVPVSLVEKPTPTIIHIDADLHRRFKAYCRRHRVTMKDCTTRLVEREMGDEALLEDDRPRARAPEKPQPVANDPVSGPPFWAREKRR